MKMKKKNKKIIFVLGVAHSGTTILYKMLACHPDLAWFSQFSQRNGKIPRRMIIPFSDFYKIYIRKLVSHSWKKKKNNIWFPRPGEANSIWKYISKIEDQNKKKETFRDIIEKELKSWKKNIIIIKNPKLGISLKFLYDTFFENSYFIHIIRDGRAVILSNLHKFLRHHSTQQAIEKSTKYWNNYISSIRKEKKNINKKHFIELRYEDFVRDIHLNIKKIFDFCDIDYIKFDFEKIPFSLESTNPRWLNDNNLEIIKKVEKVAAENLHHYKYK